MALSTEGDPRVVRGQMRIPGNRAYDEFASHRLVRDLTGNQGGIEIDDPPAARPADRRAVVHLTRVHHDDIAGFRLDLANDAPRPLCAGCHDADAELVMRVPRKGVIRKHRHRLDARDARPMLHHMMRSFGHDRIP